jgi:hypothetical protein
MVILRRMTVWLCETLCQTLLFGGVFVVMAIPYGRSQYGFVPDLLLASSLTAFVMLTTGYLLTTAVFRAFFKGRGLQFYPIIAVVLFLTHLQMLFREISEFTPPQKLALRGIGAFIVFACTFVGSRFLRMSARVGNDSVGIPP